MIALQLGQIWPIRSLFFLLVLFIILLEIYTGLGWMSGNRHAADRLHDLRAEIRTLEAEADELRSYLQQHPDDLEGDLVRSRDRLLSAQTHRLGRVRARDRQRDASALHAAQTDSCRALA